MLCSVGTRVGRCVSEAAAVESAVGAGVDRHVLEAAVLYSVGARVGRCVSEAAVL